MIPAIKSEDVFTIIEKDNTVSENVIPCFQPDLEAVKYFAYKMDIIWNSIDVDGKLPNWTYIEEPVGVDTWQSAGYTIANGTEEVWKGDCEDYAVIVASMLKSLGYDAYVAYIARTPFEEGHNVPIVVNNTKAFFGEMIEVDALGKKKMMYTIAFSKSECWGIDWQYRRYGISAIEKSYSMYLYQMFNESGLWYYAGEMHPVEFVPIPDDAIININESDA